MDHHQHHLDAAEQATTDKARIMKALSATQIRDRLRAVLKVFGALKRGVVVGGRAICRRRFLLRRGKGQTPPPARTASPAPPPGLGIVSGLDEEMLMLPEVDVQVEVPVSHRQPPPFVAGTPLLIPSPSLGVPTTPLAASAAVASLGPMFLRTPEVLPDPDCSLDESHLSTCADPQPHSALLTRLPLDVRLLIFRAVLDDSAAAAAAAARPHLHVFPSCRAWSSHRPGERKLVHAPCVAAVKAAAFVPTAVDDEEEMETANNGEVPPPQILEPVSAVSFTSTSTVVSAATIATSTASTALPPRPRCCRHWRCEEAIEARHGPVRSWVGGHFPPPPAATPTATSTNSAGPDLPSVLALMRTCRRLYLEAAPTLYSHPVFVFANFGHLLAFARAVPPQHLARLRRLEVAVHAERDAVFASHHRPPARDDDEDDDAEAGRNDADTPMPDRPDTAATAATAAESTRPSSSRSGGRRSVTAPPHLARTSTVLPRLGFFDALDEEVRKTRLIRAAARRAAQARQHWDGLARLDGLVGARVSFFADAVDGYAGGDEVRLLEGLSRLPLDVRGCGVVVERDQEGGAGRGSGFVVDLPAVCEEQERQPEGVRNGDAMETDHDDDAKGKGKARYRPATDEDLALYPFVVQRRPPPPAPAAPEPAQPPWWMT